MLLEMEVKTSLFYNKVVTLIQCANGERNDAEKTESATLATFAR